jgi:hypothetical protein
VREVLVELMVDPENRENLEKKETREESVLPGYWACLEREELRGLLERKAILACREQGESLVSQGKTA